MIGGDPNAKRLDLLTIAALLVLLGLSVRLYAVSVRKHADMLLKAEHRSRRVEVRSARRGPILDRKGRPLAMDREVIDLCVDLPELDPSLSFVVPLARVKRITRVEALALLRRAREAAAKLGPEAALDPFTLAVVPMTEEERARRHLRRSRRLTIAPTEQNGAEVLEVTVSTEVLLQRGEVVARLARLLGKPAAALEAGIRKRVDAIHAFDERKARMEEWREPHAILEAAPFDLRARVSERAFELPGLVTVKRFDRRYPRGDLAVHVVGYLREPTAAEAARDREAGLVLGGREEILERLEDDPSATIDPRTRLRREPYGRVGVERHHDARLRGTPGVKVEVRDVKNNLRASLADLPPRDGAALSLTLDVDVQRPIEQALDRAVLGKGDARSGGAVIVFDLAEGDILALASSPRFDPNTFGQTYAKLAKNPRNPLRHRAVQPLAPASTWKCLSAFAIYDGEGPTGLPPGWTTVCTGNLRIGKSSFKCEGYHGRIGLARAIERSCNVFFYAAADKIGLAPLAAWAERVGLGKPVGLDVGGEYAGLIPQPGYKEARLRKQQRAVRAWKRRMLAARYERPFAPKHLTMALARLKHAQLWMQRFAQDTEIRKGEIRNTIIGQGDVLATPLQIATIAALVATGGDWARPRLLLDTPIQRQQVELDPWTLKTVREGMRRVVTRGTARAESIGLRRLDVAGKTGTGERKKGDPYTAWFMGYYPASNPEIAFAVVVDRTHGHGGDVCGPITRKVLEAYEKARGGSLR